MKTNKFLALGFALCLSGLAQAQTVDELVDKHVAALGGLDKLSNVKTLYIERSMAINGMEIPSKSTIVVGKSMRTETSVMGNSMIQVVDGTTGWMVRPAMMGGTGDPEDMPADQLKSSKGQLDPFGALVNYKTKGNQVELVGKEKVDGKDAYHLKVTTKEGQTVDEFLDANTYLVSKVKMAMNGQNAEIAFSDYKDKDGIKFANTMEMASPQGALTFTTEKITVNGPVDESIFKKPAK
ncbi:MULTISPECIES: outer membrane lipoprotein-sorting protein [unclassified Spirosoma]|uniref:outer membrane lipoprotein-sorting protein n=1 Tax=unclassified Spirosoma TaxID=2621999 RepID=UPI00095A6999|nr:MULTISPECIES: outer membrane lipoprotein-sorting protein [unclassified Spirosoma]MBN8820875.1 outer membrane lipoprotein-sorting protein [Spirosoma sp.]OJW70848.1 MAG: outer membrane lipoprotein-sorting protein [Spirosoma sp. 48-14]